MRSSVVVVVVSFIISVELIKDIREVKGPSVTTVFTSAMVSQLNPTKFQSFDFNLAQWFKVLPNGGMLNAGIIIRKSL